MRYLQAIVLIIAAVFAPASLAQETVPYPKVDYMYNWSDTIVEDQVFVVLFNTAVDVDSVLNNSHCEVQGLGEQVATRLISGKQRVEILNNFGFDPDQENSQKMQLLQCKRMLPANARVKIVIGPHIKNIKTAAVINESTTPFWREFEVRDNFRVSFSCTRTNAQAPCSPLFPVSLNFSSPVAKKDIAEIVLKSEDSNVQADQIINPDDSATEGLLDYVSFSGPFQEKANFSLELPANLKDDVGRKLSNADSFPLQFKTDAMPPLIKFTTGEFGIIERFAAGAPGTNPDISIPLAMRRVSGDLLTQELKASAGQSSDFVVQDAVQAIRWLSRIKRMSSGEYNPGQMADIAAVRKIRSYDRNEPQLDVRSRSVFTNKDSVSKLKLPGLQDVTSATAEIVGLPVKDPGLHVIEIESPELGAALLDDKPGYDKMYVRTAVLVTNLSVHLKTGRDDTLVWVTSLDNGKPVKDAAVRILNCEGKELLSGNTGKDGILHVDQHFDTYSYCASTGLSGIFATANIPASHPQAYGKADFAMVSSNWDNGIEPWRFDIPYSRDKDSDTVAHAVLDRTLFHAGETVSMKLFVRGLNRHGWFSYPPEGLEGIVKISHLGSSEEFNVPVTWDANKGGGVYGVAEFKTNKKAKLGEYSITIPLLEDEDSYWTPTLYAGSFRVEEFKLPVLEGSIKLFDQSKSNTKVLVAPKDLNTDIQINWIAGGPAKDLQTELSAMARPMSPNFVDYPNYRFDTASDLSTSDYNIRRLILDKKPVVLDDKGAARVVLDDLPVVKQPQNWLFETTFKDPNGEVQTISQSKDIWPAAIAIGIKSGYWLNKGDSATVKLLVLDTNSKPVANKEVQLDGEIATTYTTRKRIVGGFYSYDSHQQKTSLGTLCEGSTDKKGILSCSIKLDRDGEVQLFASAKDDAGNIASSAVSVWVWGDSAWFNSSDNDRIDVIADKPSYKPGDIAKLSVRMPFKQAEALVAIEREGILSTQVHELQGEEPVINLKIEDEWGPNVYVSVLAVRGRIRSVPWSSFFEWGWRHPWLWLDARSSQQDAVAAPTAFVDLAKPAYKFGLTELKVSAESDRLNVAVNTDKNTYQVRDTISADVKVQLPDGKPASGAGLAVAVVDKALLELYGNDSWNLLEAMRTTRSYGVATATAQSEVVGRRHYGRKAVPAGGGGGHSVSRELFDTLLLWQANLELDDNGTASIKIPINDSITSFRIVAVADYGEDKFGTGYTDVISTQDLQIISGLPQIIREDDKFQAQITLRNRTEDDFITNVSASYEYPAGEQNNLSAQKVQINAGSSKTISWDLVAPELVDNQNQINWHLSANAGESKDSLIISQNLLPRIPIKPFNAELVHLQNNDNYSLPISVPDNALIDQSGKPKGGVSVLLQADLGSSLPGVYDWLQRYPYTCIEQQSAKYIGMQNLESWQALMADLPNYLRDSGLLSYFPNGRGNVNLTAHIIEITELAQQLDQGFKLPDYAREAMLEALQDFANGRLSDNSWLPSSNDLWRQINVLSALSRADALQSGMLDKLYMPVNDWPTTALVAWLNILESNPTVYQRDKYLNQVNQALKSRIRKHGTTVILADDSVDYGWWLMSSQETVQAKFLLAVLRDPYWAQDLPLIFNGLLSLQQDGHWSTTTANVLGALAVKAFAQQEQSASGIGNISVTTNVMSDKQSFAWSKIKDAEQEIELNWPNDGNLELNLQQDNQGDGWATIVSKAAIPYQTSTAHGIKIERQIRPISQSEPGNWSVGDIYRVTLKINSSEPLNWAAISDPLPAGAVVLGTGLGRDSAIALEADAEQTSSWWDRPTYIERANDVYRAYYEYLATGEHIIEYTVRLNTAGKFNLPATRVEALYQPDIFGVTPNQPFKVQDK